MALGRRFSGSQAGCFFPFGFSFNGDRWTIVSNWSRSMWFSPMWLHNASIPGLEAGLFGYTSRHVSSNDTVIEFDINFAFNSNPLFRKNNMFPSPVDSYTAAAISILSVTPF
jgi:hypothetical protein